jgi:dinuclear metal center YbgI/SA1388 family protein
MVCVGDLLRWIDAYAPFQLAEKWDHCGLQGGSPAAEVDRVLVALDVSSRTIEEAIRLRCRAIVTHHPLIFRPMAAIREDEFPGALVSRAIRGHLNLIAAHTNLDIARDGTNDRLCSLMGLEGTVSLDKGASVEADGSSLGIGRVGSLGQAVPLLDLARKLERTLAGAKVKVVGNPERSIQRIAVCTGSGGSLLELALTAGVDAYVTGDTKYHEGQRAVEEGLALIDVGHFASEHLIIHPLADYLLKCSLQQDANLEVLESTVESDPFWYV